MGGRQGPLSMKLKSGRERPELVYAAQHLLKLVTDFDLETMRAVYRRVAGMVLSGPAPDALRFTGSLAVVICRLLSAPFGATAASQ
jgi:hypothetical protein